MNGFSLRRPSPATVISAVALFVALGSGAYAASHLSRNSVGSKAIKNGAVKSPDIHNGAVKGHDIGGKQVGTGKIKNGAVTSVKAGFIRKTGVPLSDQAVIDWRIFRHGDLINFWTVLQHEGLFLEFVRTYEATPFAEGMRTRALDGLRDYTSTVGRAWALPSMSVVALE